MPAAAASTTAVVLLAASLAIAVARPRGLPEVVGAGPAAVLVVLLGVLPLSAAADEVARLAPTVGFLAAVLVLAELCDRAGLFTAAGAWLTAASRASPVRLLRLVFVVAAGTTAVLSLDATVVLLTPVVLTAAVAVRLRPKPYVYACGHLANSASLLLPVSNLTNLLAYRDAGLSFLGFTAHMVLPWCAVLIVEWVAFRFFFAADLAHRPPAADPAAERRPMPVYPLVVLALTLAGFAAGPLVHLDPAVVAAAGAVALAVPALRARRVTPARLLRAAQPAFLAFVLALGVVVRAVEDGGLGALAARLVPDGSSLPELLAIAGVAAVLANLVNNLPAVLILLPAVTAAGPAGVLAALIGVNVGPHATYVGSLATLLWRRIVRQRAVDATQAEFLRLGALTVPAGLLLATVALWATTR